MDLDGFHPDFDAKEPGVHMLQAHRVHHIKAADIDPDTAQTEGMQRFAEQLWMADLDATR